MPLNLKELAKSYKNIVGKEPKPISAAALAVESDIALAEANLGLLQARSANEKEIEKAQERLTDLQMKLAAKKAEIGL